MAIWNSTAAMLLETRNGFLKDLSVAGHDIEVLETVTVDAVFDPVSETMTGGSTRTETTLFRRKALLAPIKTLASDGQTASVASAGVKIDRLTIEQSLVLKLHPSVPLATNVSYRVNGRLYRLDQVLSNVVVGKVACWNLVVLVNA